MEVEIRCEHGDITAFSADVVALKYARAFFGADGAVMMRLDPNLWQLALTLQKINGLSCRSL